MLMMIMMTVYYMINYATKYDVSQYQLILTAAIVKQAVEETNRVIKLSEKQLRIRYQDQNKFALQAFNCLSDDHKISSSQAASCFFDLSDYYMLSIKI